MDIFSTSLISALLLLAALGLMYWHVLSWRRAQLADLAAGELDFYRRQFRRRIQTSAMLGILALMIFVGELLTWWINSHVFFIIYWAVALLLVVFAIRLAKTKKFMPSGLMLVVTIAALALRNLFGN